MKLVLDTNAVLDWLHFRDAGFSPVAEAIANRTVQLVTAADCLEELRRVLARPHFSLDATAQAALIQQYKARVTMCEITDGQVAAADLPLCRDTDDQKFLRLARQAGAGYLLTKDKALLRLSAAAARRCGFAVLTPRRFAATVLQVSSARR